MNNSLIPIIVFLAALAAAALAQSKPADDLADIPSREFRAGGDENKRCFLIGPATAAQPPADGYSVLLVLPGGDGGESFQPFVKRVYKYALPENYVVVQLVAHKWTPQQKIIWPSRKDKIVDSRFCTEEFIESVAQDVQRQLRVNPKRIFLLAWSSSGPAAYAASLQTQRTVSASYISMSVFLPLLLPPLNLARGHAYYIEHSPEDRVCVFDFAKQAIEYLTAQGAATTLSTYEGGHGWHGDVYGRIRTGIEWMEQHAGRPIEETADAIATTPVQERSTTSRPTGSTRSLLRVTPTTPNPPPESDEDLQRAENKKPVAPPPTRNDQPAAAPASQPALAANLLLNGGFENGSAGWMILNNSGRATIEADRKIKAAGARSLKITKTAGGATIDVVRQNITDLPKSKRLSVSASFKAQGVKNAFLKFFIYDANDNPLNQDVDMEHIVGTADWRRIERSYDLPENAASAAVMFVMVLDGIVWLDEIQVTATE